MTPRDVFSIPEANIDLGTIHYAFRKDWHENGGDPEKMWEEKYKKEWEETYKKFMALLPPTE